VVVIGLKTEPSGRNSIKTPRGLILPAPASRNGGPGKPEGLKDLKEILPLFARQDLFNSLLHLPSWLKNNHLARGDRNAFASSRVSPKTGTPLFSFKNPKIAQLHFLGTSQTVHNHVKGLLDNPLDIHLLDAGHICDL